MLAANWADLQGCIRAGVGGLAVSVLLTPRHVHPGCGRFKSCALGLSFPINQEQLSNIGQTAERLRRAIRFSLRSTKWSNSCTHVPTPFCVTARVILEKVLSKQGYCSTPFLSLAHKGFPFCLPSSPHRLCIPLSPHTLVCPCCALGWENILPS